MDEYGDGWDYPDNWLDEPEDLMSDAEADAAVFASAGWGTDEDYGHYGNEDAALEGSLFGWDC
jgi:hypothetical protein